MASKSLCICMYTGKNPLRTMNDVIAWIFIHVNVVFAVVRTCLYAMYVHCTALNTLQATHMLANLVHDNGLQSKYIGCRNRTMSAFCTILSVSLVLNK